MNRTWCAYLVATSSRILCAARSYLQQRGAPSTSAALAQHDCLLLRDRDRPFSALRLRGPQSEETGNVTGPVGTNQCHGVRCWAEAGLDITLPSRWDVAAALQAGPLVQVLPHDRQSADIDAAKPMRVTQSAKVQVCGSFLKDALAVGARAHALKH